MLDLSDLSQSGTVLDLSHLAFFMFRRCRGGGEEPARHAVQPQKAKRPSPVIPGESRRHRSALAVNRVDRKILLIEVRALVQAVKRNVARFPADFMFRLTTEEREGLRSQTVTSKAARGGRRYAP